MKRGIVRVSWFHYVKEKNNSHYHIVDISIWKKRENNYTINLDNTIKNMLILIFNNCYNKGFTSN